MKKRIRGHTVWGQKTSPFPKLTLANEQGIIYNQDRDS